VSYDSAKLPVAEETPETADSRPTIRVAAPDRPSAIQRLASRLRMMAENIEQLSEEQLAKLREIANGTKLPWE
jgi:hypothetical protein